MIPDDPLNWNPPNELFWALFDSDTRPWVWFELVVRLFVDEDRFEALLVGPFA